MGCGSSRDVTHPSKVLPAGEQVESIVSIPPCTGSKSVEFQRTHRKIHIEIISHEQIVADAQVEHLGQMAKAAKKGDAKKKGKKTVSIQEVEEPEAAEEDAKSEGKKSKKKPKKPAKETVSISEVPEDVVREAEVEAPRVSHEEREAARFQHLLAKYPDYEFVKKVGDGSFGEVICVRDKNTQEEITLYV